MGLGGSPPRFITTYEPRVEIWEKEAIPKLEAFLKDHVSRAQLKKLQGKLQELLEVEESNWETADAIIPSDLKERGEKESLMAYSHGRRKLLKQFLKCLEML